jgi:signal peptidase II
MTPKFRFAFGAALIAFALDLATKLAIDAKLSYTDRIPIIEGFFYLTHVRNTGAAFGLFADAPAVYRLTFFITVSLVAVAIIAAFYRNLAPGDRLAALALGLVLGGAVGNLVDRIFRHEVIDFLHFRLWRGHSWPDFNVADSAIVVGVGLLVLDMLASEGERRASANDGESSSQSSR